jgi:RNA polymerase sigma-70 factor (sigma-E family)
MMWVMAGKGERERDFRGAFADLFPAAFRVALRLVGDVTIAEDVAAEALGRAYSQWERVADLPYLEAWVMRVASNVAIDMVRKRRGIPLASPPAVDPADAAATRVTLVAALRMLPERQRDVVVLRYLSDMSEADVAAALGLAPGTVKTHLRRGLEALRGLVGDPAEGRLHAF